MVAVATGAAARRVRAAQATLAGGPPGSTGQTLINRIKSVLDIVKNYPNLFNETDR